MIGGMLLVTGGCIVSHWGVCRQSKEGVASVKRRVSIHRVHNYCTK